MELDVEKFRNKYQLTPDQLRRTKLSSEDIEIAQKILLAIEDMLLENIADWSLDESFFLYDEKEDLIYRFFQFSKGLSKNYLVISSEPQIELISNEMENTLLLHISNIRSTAKIKPIPSIGICGNNPKTMVNITKPAPGTAAEPIEANVAVIKIVS